jgi:hypothetical protein
MSVAATAVQSTAEICVDTQSQWLTALLAAELQILALFAMPHLNIVKHAMGT